ncbi:MAG: hypothetical protein HOP37_04860 [Cyclobacteriaceae bacterium]|nr:hypothetical protein [Cyclobacteriaceae bacterium]
MRLQLRNGDRFAPLHFPSLVLAMTLRKEDCLPVRLGRLHATSLATAGVRNDGFTLRHCEHRAKVFCAGGKACLAGQAGNLRH